MKTIEDMQKDFEEYKKYLTERRKDSLIKSNEPIEEKIKTFEEMFGYKLII